MKTLFVLVAIVVSASAFSQIPDTLNMKCQPKAGKAALQIVYYRIDFTPKETEYLRTHAAELIFSVSDKGIAKLEKVNDIEMRSIIDSMMNVNDRLPPFYAERVNGRAEAGVYFLKLAWPNYQSQAGVGSPYQPFTIYPAYPRKLSEFSEITYRGPRYDMIFGGFMANFSGPIGKETNGWGTKFDFMIYGKKGWGGGFGTTMIIAEQTELNSSGTFRVPDRRRVITLISGMAGKLFPESRVGQLEVHLEPALAISGSTGSDPDVPAVGFAFTPGIAACYMVSLGPGRMVRQYILPTAYKHYLSFHVAARSMMFNQSSMRGNVFEFGIAYRLASRPVMNYELKE